MVEFGELSPMLAHRMHSPFSSADYIFEVKWDGYRALAYAGSEGVRYQSRQGKDLSGTFPQLQTPMDGFPEPGMVLDGEIVSLVEDRSSFHHLRRGQGTIVYVVFDLLATAGGRPITNQSWHERRHLLEAAWKETAHWCLSPVVAKDGHMLWQLVTRQGFEGMMAKKRTSPYLSGQRSRHWLKLSHRQTLDCVIVGLSGRGAGRLASVGVAVYRKDVLEYLGQVGSGLSSGVAEHIMKAVRSAPESPVKNLPPKHLLWVVPSLVCTVEYLEITPAHRLRHPVLRQLRPELSPADCQWPVGRCEDEEGSPG